MALTPEDVVNKRFNPTKFREGYDQDEVDDFLDEVVVELRRLGQENEELRQRLVAADARISELQRAAAGAPAIAAAPAPLATPAPVAAPAPAEAPAVYTAPEVSSVDPNNTNNLLQLARRLHEEHVREGIEKRDALIAEGQAAATRIVQEAEGRAAGLVQEAESAAQAKIGSLDQQRVELEHKVEELRTFEREYRDKLKDYIQSQLRELEGSAPASVAPAAPAAAEGFPPPSTGGFPAPAPTTGGFAAAPTEFAPPADYPAPVEQNGFGAFPPPADFGYPQPEYPGLADRS